MEFTGKFLLVKDLADEPGTPYLGPSAGLRFIFDSAPNGRNYLQILRKNFSR
jgi:hypothetical protein